MWLSRLLPHTGRLGVPGGEPSTGGNSPGRIGEIPLSLQAEHSSPHVTIKPREGCGTDVPVPSPALETALQHLNN